MTPEAYIEALPPEGRRIFRLYLLAALRQPDAFWFLVAFHGWAHLIDDLVDEPERDRLQVVDVAMKANVLFTSAFYQAHAQTLSVVTALIADAYRTSVLAERLGGAAARLADTIRMAGNQMVVAVAMIVGGWEHMQQISAQLWPLAWENQHTVTVN